MRYQADRDYLVDSTICLLLDWDNIDNEDQAMVSEIKHSVSNPLRELNNYYKAMYIIYSLFLELWQKQAGKEVLTIFKKGYLGRSIFYLLIGFFEEKSEPPTVPFQGKQDYIADYLTDLWESPGGVSLDAYKNWVPLI